MGYGHEYEVKIAYEHFLSATIKHLEDYIANRGGTLDLLKFLCRECLTALTEEEQEKIDTVRNLLEALKECGAVGQYDKWFIDVVFARGLDLPDLKKEVEHYDLKMQSISGYMWEMFEEEARAPDIPAPLVPAPLDEISIGENGGSYIVRRSGISLYVPPFAVAEPVTVTCSVHSNDYSPSPAGVDETLVSYIVELGPKEVDIRQPIKVTMMHSGPGRDLGYETIVKTFNRNKDAWEEIEDLDDKSNLPEHSIQVEINKLAVLAVVTRLIKDRFQVTPKGCVIRSSVCDDVIVEFPEGAVNNTVEGTLKLMLMPDHKIIHQIKDACPILCVDGFSSITFSKPVVVKMPIPNNTAEHPTSDIRLLRLEDNNWEDNKWKDVTHEAVVLQCDTHVEFHVKQFSSLWLWMSKAFIQYASTIFQCISLSPPQVVFFAAFKTNKEASWPVLSWRQGAMGFSFRKVQKLTLVCVANHKQYETVRNMRDEGYARLAAATGRSMRPNDKAFLKINGAKLQNVTARNFFLSFLKGEVCRRELSVCDAQQDEDNPEEMVVHFFPKPDENFDLLLCTLQISKDQLFPERQSSPSTQREPEVPEQAQPGDQTDDVTCTKGHRYAMPYQHHMPLLTLEENIGRLKHSIGAIVAVNVSGVETLAGTCFRIGSKYVITCEHVIDDIKKLGIDLSNCCVDFNYGEIGEPGNRFHFTPNPVLLSSKLLDYAILELHPNGVEDYPPSLNELGFNIAPPGRQLQGGECLTLIGHPGGRKKQIDVSCPIKRVEDIQNLQLNEFPTIQRAYNHPDFAKYDVSTFFWGSSGSPGLSIGEKLLVVLHKGGFATQETNRSSSLEYGTLMSSVVRDVTDKVMDGTIQTVTNMDDIFGPSTSTSIQGGPEPMDVDTQDELAASGSSLTS